MTQQRKKVAKLKDKDEVESFFGTIFKKVQRNFTKFDKEYELSGTCVSSILLIENKCYSVNLGDSRAIVGSLHQNGMRTAYQISRDHKANEEEEKKRIEAKGGLVTVDRYNK